MRVVLIVTDGSAVDVAVDFLVSRLGIARESEIYVLTVAEPPKLDRWISGIYGYPVSQSLMQPIVSQAEENGALAAEKLRSCLPSSDARSVCDQGDLLERATKRCAEWQPDLLVITESTPDGVSVSPREREIVRQCACSVVLLKSPLKSDAGLQPGQESQRQSGLQPSHL